jgi:hypothetical protein
MGCDKHFITGVNGMGEEEIDPSPKANAIPALALT